MRGTNQGVLYANYRLHPTVQNSEPRYDQTQYEPTEQNNQETILTNALRVLNSKSRSVQRSSGGRVIAEPYQIVYYDPIGSTKGEHPEVRIKVRFRDLKFSASGRLVTYEPVTHTKVVSASDLKDAFSFVLDDSRPQSFVMDFGQGIVPVFVICYEKRDHGGEWAYLARPDTVAELSSFNAGKRVTVQVYRVPKEVLRYASRRRVNGQRSEYEMAEENYSLMKSRRQVTLPSDLAVGNPIAMPTRHNLKEVRNYLAALVENKIRLPKQQDYENLVKEYYIDDDLLPFGLFESHRDPVRKKM